MRLSGRGQSLRPFHRVSDTNDALAKDDCIVLSPQVGCSPDPRNGLNRSTRPPFRGDVNAQSMKRQ
jgi:hypothetical protein